MKRAESFHIEKNEIAKIINAAKKGKKKVCAFGTGKIGTGIGADLLKRMRIEIDYYCDNDSRKWGMVICNSILCISLEQLNAIKENIICFVLVGSKYVLEVCSQLRSMGITEIVPFGEEYIPQYGYDVFYTFDAQRNRYMQNKSTKKVCTEKGIIKGEKIAIYTCITGGFDEIKEPEYVSESCDYFLLSDKKPNHLKIYEWMNIKDFIPDTIQDDRRKNRYCKMHPHLIFPQYDYSIYLDGSIQIIKDIVQYVEKIGRSGIATYLHPKRKCIYEEGIICAAYQMDNVGTIINQMTGYWEKGMPSDFGLREMGILVRRHNSEICIELMDAWWYEVKRKSYRDQLSFTYVLWKRGLQIRDVGVLGSDIRQNKSLRLKDHKQR